MNVDGSVNLSIVTKQTLPVYESMEELSSKLDDYLNVILLPGICLLGIFTNGLSLAVLAKMASNELIHLYMLVNSVVDLAFLLSQFFLIVIRCGSICPFGYTYSSKVYELYVYLHMGYTFALFVAFNDIGMSIDRVLSFRFDAAKSHHAVGSKASAASSSVRRNYFIRILLFFVASFVLNLPMYVLSREIAPVMVLTAKSATDLKLNSSSTLANYDVLYVVKTKREWDESPSLRRFRAASWTAIRVGLFFVLLVVNLFVYIKFRSQIRMKSQLSMNSNVQKTKSAHHNTRVTLMLTIICATYFLGNVLDFFFPVVADALDKPSLNAFIVVLNLFLFGSHCLSFHIYYFFDSAFKRTFKKMFLSRIKRTSQVGSS